MIQPGLARIARLVRHTPITWHYVHVAGTNGKGSVCAYLAAMLHSQGIRAGRFTSPHLIDRWDGINIAEEPISEGTFRLVEEQIAHRNEQEGIAASEFELLTAAAFEIFTREQVRVAVVEAGLGGRDDATNVLPQPLVTIITKIGLDHQDLLGPGLVDIARHKAGIMKLGAPGLVDATNEPVVHGVIEERSHALTTGSGPTPVVSINGAKEGWLSDAILRILIAGGKRGTSEELTAQDNSQAEPQDALSNIEGKEHRSTSPSSIPTDLEPHQRIHLGLALAALRIVCGKLDWDLKDDGIRRAIAAALKVEFPGRLQHCNITSLTGRSEEVLIDGAHNPQSAEVLATHVNRRLRVGTHPVTWVLAATCGKDFKAIVSSLIQANDHVVLVEFGPVDGMPWVKSRRSHHMLDIIKRMELVPEGNIHDAGHDVLGALHKATDVANGGPLVTAGSLYLVSDVMRLLRDKARTES